MADTETTELSSTDETAALPDLTGEDSPTNVLPDVEPLEGQTRDQIRRRLGLDGPRPPRGLATGGPSWSLPDNWKAITLALIAGAILTALAFALLGGSDGTSEGSSGDPDIALPSSAEVSDSEEEEAPAPTTEEEPAAEEESSGGGGNSGGGNSAPTGGATAPPPAPPVEQPVDVPEPEPVPPPSQPPPGLGLPGTP